MSVEAMAAVLHHSKAKGTTKLILVGIANHAGDGGAFPAMSTLAKYGGCNQRNARAAVARLVALGEVKVHVQGGRLDDVPDERQPNRYDVLVECPPWCDRTTNHRDLRKRGRGVSPLWINGGSLATGGEEGGSDATGGAPVASDRLTIPTNPPPSGSALTTGQASERGDEDGPTCSTCSQPRSVCLRRARTSGHTYTPRRAG